MKLRFPLLLALLFVFPSCSDRDSDGKTPLYLAAERGDLARAQKLLDEGADVNSSNVFSGNTPFFLKWYPGDQLTTGLRPLHAAVKNGHAEMTDLLIVRGADVGARDENERTPLALAAISHDNAKVAEILIANGADIESLGAQGFSPLTLAAREGHLEIVRVLISKGALVNRPTHDGRTALHFATEYGHSDIAAFLLQSGAQPGKTMGQGQNPLQLAVLSGNEAVVRELLEKGNDPDEHAPGTSPLLIAAAYSGHATVVELLLEYGAQVGQTSEGWTALQHAVDGGHAEAVNVLILCGAEIDRRDPETNQTPLQQAIEKNEIEVAQVLLEGGAHPDATVSPLPPPLALAAREGYLEIVELLVLHEADVNIRDGRWTPLKLAEFGNHQAVVDFLKVHGAEQ
jgi:ankyrin repeat protein